MAVVRSLAINAPAEQVFAYVADITKHPEWGKEGHKLQIEKTSDGPIGKGSTFKSVGHQFGRNEDTVSIVDYVQDQRVAYEANGNAGIIRHAFEVTPEEGGVRLTKSFDAVQRKLPFALFAPVALLFVVPGALKGDLQRIKAKIEGS